MSERRTERDRRRRSLGQNFLADATVVGHLIDGLDLAAGDLVVDIGAGTGALTVPLALHEVDATIWAVEPVRADLVVQREVARKLAASPATTLRAAGWAPWWEFRLGRDIDRRSFRPVPSVDATVLTIRRRRPAILPVELASALRPAMRTAWTESYEAPGSRHGQRPRRKRRP